MGRGNSEEREELAQCQNNILNAHYTITQIAKIMTIPGSVRLSGKTRFALRKPQRQNQKRRIIDPIP